jgi:peptidoglycan hydrolase-like protein with peptidoglycan-binding domain
MDPSLREHELPPLNTGSFGRDREPARPRRRRRAAVAVVALVAFGAAGGAAVLSGGERPRPPASALRGATTVTVERRDLVLAESEDGTLGYSGKAAVYARVQGTVTWLAREGSVVRRGQQLLAVDGRPVVLLHGDQPAYRDLRLGVGRGDDVRQLERNMAALGFVPGLVDGRFSATTTAAVKRWQGSLGLRRTGAVELGRVVFLPGARRVGEVKVALGSVLGGGGSGDGAGGDGGAGSGAGGGPSGRSGSGSGSGSAPATEVMDTTSTRRIVLVKLDATKQQLARRGASARVTLPDGSAASGRIASVGSVAKGGSGSGDGGDPGSGTAKVTVTVRLTSRLRGQALDQAPVTVELTKERRSGVLAVPVAALVATPGGGYAIDAVGAAGTRRLPVRTGVFANGYVEVTGRGVREGLRILSAQ